MTTETIIDIQVNLTLPVLSNNFDVFKNQLTEKLQKYDIDVTEETFLESEILIKEINKIIKNIDTRKKEVINEITAPIDEFKQSCKELVSLCEEAKNNLILQGQAFQTKRLNGWKAILNEDLFLQYKAFTIQDEFKTLNVDDLAMKSNFTDKNNLTASTKNIIDSKIQAILLLQNKVAMRLVELENKCLKAGLILSLERRHIENFIKSDDETYNKHLNILFENELTRQNEIILEQERKQAQILLEQKKEQERILAEQERKQAQILLEQKKEQERILAEQERKQAQILLEQKKEQERILVEQERKHKAEIEAMQTKEAEPVKQKEVILPPVAKVNLDNSKIVFNIIATFTIEVDNNSNETEESIKERFYNKMKNELASFKSLKSLEVKQIN